MDSHIHASTPKQHGRWMTATQAAAAFRVSRRTIYNWFERDRFKAKLAPSGVTWLWVDDEWLHGPAADRVPGPQGRG